MIDLSQDLFWLDTLFFDSLNFHSTILEVRYFVIARAKPQCGCAAMCCDVFLRYMLRFFFLCQRIRIFSLQLVYGLRLWSRFASGSCGFPLNGELALLWPPLLLLAGWISKSTSFTHPCLWMMRKLSIAQPILTYFDYFLRLKLKLHEASRLWFVSGLQATLSGRHGTMTRMWLTALCLPLLPASLAMDSACIPKEVCALEVLMFHVTYKYP